ncbi:MAG: hypothetical protein HQ559_14240 [Lentisphaerae bacterium]|nr:hypothetical protein [Lentisphaerota bacterium]
MRTDHLQVEIALLVACGLLSSCAEVSQRKGGVVRDRRELGLVNWVDSARRVADLNRATEARLRGALAASRDHKEQVALIEALGTFMLSDESVGVLCTRLAVTYDENDIEDLPSATPRVKEGLKWLVRSPDAHLYPAWFVLDKQGGHAAGAIWSALRVSKADSVEFRNAVLLLSQEHMLGTGKLVMLAQEDGGSPDRGRAAKIQEILRSVWRERWIGCQE